MFEAHFQTFEEPESGVALTARLSAFREELARRKLTGFVIPRADQQQNEYVAPSEERLAWLTGFTGSAGLRDRADARRPPCSSMAATRCRRQNRSMARPGASSRWSIRRRKAGWRSILRPATASDLIHGCTLRRQPNGWPRPAPRPARNWSRSTATRSIPYGPSARRRRSARSPFTARNFPAKRRAEKLEAHPRRDRTARRRRAGAVGFARGGLDLQHPRRRRLAYAAAAVLCAGAEGRPPHRLHRSPQALQQRARPSRAIRRCRRTGRADA